MFRQIERYVLAFVRCYLGGFYLVSGLNFFLHFWAQPIPQDPTGAAYMNVTLTLGLFQLAKVVEAVGGFLLLFDIAVPFALVFLFPIATTVMIMNWFFADLIHVRISGMRNFVMHIILFAGYAGYFLPLLKFGARPSPIWRTGEQAAGAAAISPSGALQNG